MRPSLRPLPRQWHRISHLSLRSTSTQPPAPRVYEKVPAKEPAPPPVPEYKPGFISRLFANFKTKPLEKGHDPARGLEATRRVVTEGVLDPRYKQAARVYIRLIIALPLAIVLSLELYRRRFLGAKQKEIPAVKGKEDNVQDVVKEEVG